MFRYGKTHVGIESAIDSRKVCSSLGLKIREQFHHQISFCLYGLCLYDVI